MRSETPPHRRGSLVGNLIPTMHRLRRYHSHLRARLAASHLNHHGVPATVGEAHTLNALGIAHLNAPFVGYDLYVAHRDLADHAEALLHQLDTSEPVDADMLAIAAEPDLSLINPNTYPIDCATCGAQLPLDPSRTTCASCGEPADIIERLIHTHGPEALEHAYPCTDDESAISPEDIPLPCTSCRHNLAGLPRRGRCPECGSLFDKTDMLRSL